MGIGLTREEYEEEQREHEEAIQALQAKLDDAERLRSCLGTTEAKLQGAEQLLCKVVPFLKESCEDCKREYGGDCKKEDCELDNLLTEIERSREAKPLREVK